MKCQRCQIDIPEKESFNHIGETICEDCYMDAMSPPKNCDPWATYLATHTKEVSGLDVQLTPFQKTVYEIIRQKKRITAVELMASFNIGENDLASAIATLRHCEKVKGQKEGDIVYLVPFDLDQLD